MQRLKLQDGREVHFLPATVKDVHAIYELYQKVYKGHYTLKDVTDLGQIKKKIEDPTYFWAVAHVEGELIGSVIYAIDPVNKIGKCYAAAVLNEFRGQDVMRSMVLQGLERLTKRTRTCDVIYATTRTVSFAPQVVLEHVGFHPMGIFPNVRKVESFETHGLEIFFRDSALKLRRKKPTLVPEVRDFYLIVKDILQLEDHDEVELPLADPRKMGSPIDFEVNRNESEVLAQFDYSQNRDLLDKLFFPFVEPNLLFFSKDKNIEIFVNFNESDGHGVIIAYRIGSNDLRHVIMWFSEKAALVGMRYIELLVNSFKPEMQRMALDAKYLPCAYFPAMRMNDLGQREDYIVFSRSVESLDFMDMHLVRTNRRFLDAFMKCWYEMLVRCQPEFDEGWRIG